MKSSGRRTRRACDGCRVSKVKCSGSIPCDHCLGSNIPCLAELYSSETGPHKSSQRQIQYLLFERTRLTRALQQLYRQTLLGRPWVGDPVSELPSDGPSIHEILQRLEGGNTTENGMDRVEAKKELISPSSRPGSQDSDMLDTVCARLPEDSMRLAKPNAEKLLIPSSTQVMMSAPISTPVVDVPVRAFNSGGAVVSTAGVDGFSPQSDGSPIYTSDSFGDVYLPPWTFHMQMTDDFSPSDSTGFSPLHLP